MSANVRIEIEDITPSKAKYWLDNANTHNRSAAKKVVKAYADDMKAGRWEFTSQGISFYENGVLADGQHRLMAIVESGITVKMIVTYGLPTSAINGIDQHRVRAVHDVLTLNGGFGRIDATDVATLRLCYSNMKSNAALAEKMLEDNYVELKKVKEMFGSKSSTLGGALIRAAVLLALKDGQPEDELKEFVEVLLSGVTERLEHRTIIILRDAVMRGDFKKGGDSQRRRNLKVIQRMISRFLSGEVAKRMPNTPDNYTYPLLKIKEADNDY